MLCNIVCIILYGILSLTVHTAAITVVIRSSRAKMLFYQHELNLMVLKVIIKVAWKKDVIMAMTDHRWISQFIINFKKILQCLKNMTKE